MVEKIFFLGVLMATLSLHAMEHNILPKITLQKWENLTDYVKIESTKIIAWYPINDLTTVFDIKDFIFQKDGIPVGQQKLFTYDSYGFTQLVIDETGNNVDNREKIKKLMSTYNTNSFYMYHEPQDTTLD
jgi:hypothetical protein